MKASELMIGDIITFKDSVETDKTPIPIKVTALGYQYHGNENEALVQIGNDVGNDIVTIDDNFVGYPLTPKILEKNGFSQDPLNGHIFIFQEKSGEVIHYEYGPKYGLTIDNQLATIQDLKINYVHQLQHALRLCGIEKEIKI